MKLNKIFCSAMLLIAPFISSDSAKAQLKTPAASPMQTIDQAFGISNIKIEYSRPSVKNRVIFGELVPYGKIWRTGANASTKITVGEDVKIEGKSLPAGTYAIYTIPGKESWDVLIYKDLKLGGGVNEYKAENEVMRFKGKVSTLTNPVETFTINVADMTNTTCNIAMEWEKTRVTFGLSTEIDAAVMKNIDAALEKDSRPFYQAANYYYENGKDLSKALQWTNSAIEANPKAYWIYHLKAKIQKKMNDNTGAIATATRSLELAREDKNEDFVAMNEKFIAEAKKGK